MWLSQRLLELAELSLGCELGLAQLQPSSHSGTHGNMERVLLLTNSRKTGDQNITKIHFKSLLTSCLLNFHWPKQVSHQGQRQWPRDVQSTHIPKGSARS